MISVDISVDASVDVSVTTRSSIDRVSVDNRPRYRPTVGRVSVEYRRCVGLHVGRYVCRPISFVISLTLGRYLIDTLPIVYRYLTDTQSTHGQSMI